MPLVFGLHRQYILKWGFHSITTVYIYKYLKPNSAYNLKEIWRNVLNIINISTLYQYIQNNVYLYIVSVFFKVD